MSFYQKHVFVCANVKDNGKKCCGQAGGAEAFAHLKTTLEAKGLHGAQKTRVSRSGCLGRCASGPCLVIYPQERWYTYHNQDDLDEIISSELEKNEPVSHLLLAD